MLIKIQSANNWQRFSKNARDKPDLNTVTLYKKQYDKKKKNQNSN